MAESQILAAWRANAAPWTTAVRAGAIEGRRQVSDRAIVDAVVGMAPRSVLDIGCGEGWLVRALAARGIDALGVDAIPALIEVAQAGGGRFLTLGYADLASGALAERFDVAVCNFSLLGGASVDQLLRAVPALLATGGRLIVQTLHPWTACGDAPYQSGWREGSWAGCGEGFGDAAPWYFRTMADWLASFTDAGLRLVRMTEPAYSQSGRPASVIVTLSGSRTA